MHKKNNAWRPCQTQRCRPCDLPAGIYSWSSVRPYPGHLGVGVGHAGEDAGVECGRCQLFVALQFTSDELCCHMGFVHRLVCQHGWPTMSPVAKMWGTLARIWISTETMPRSVTATPALSAATVLPLSVRPTALGMHLAIRTGSALRCNPIPGRGSHSVTPYGRFLVKARLTCGCVQPIRRHFSDASSP